MFKLRSLALLSIALFVLSGCTCCLYLNHYYNVEKYFDKAVNLKKERLEMNPQDSAWVNNDEKASLNKAIEKCSAILERWPNEAQYKPKVLFVMGESFLKLGSWVPAIQKYDEYLKYFPEGEQIPTVNFNKAFALARSGKPSLAKFALQPILADNQHMWHSQALALMAKLQLSNDNPESAIETLEALLKLKDGNPRLRAQALFQLGGLYFSIKKYDKSRERYKNPEIEILGNSVHYKALFSGAKSAYVAKQYSLAIQDLQDILSEKKFQNQKVSTQLTLAHYLIVNQEYSQGLEILHTIKIEHAKSGVAAEAYYWIGDYYEIHKTNYQNAMLNYDSSQSSEPKSIYGVKSAEKLKTLKKLTAWHHGKSHATTSSSQNFQIAELFLFELGQTDSALNILAGMVHQKNQLPTVRMKAAYAQAFITDEFTDNKKSSDSLYQWIIQEFPKSTYAKQSQKNLGLKVTVQTNDDLAKAQYLIAEKAYDNLQSQSMIQEVVFDSLEAKVLSQFDSIALKFPLTQEAPRALFFKAHLYENQHFDRINAKIQYQSVLDQYPDTPWGERAAEKLSGKLTELTPAKMTLIRQGYKNSITSFDRRLVQIKNRRRATIERQERKEKAEEQEQLLWDYNDMYDVEN